jgi:hypothetical protein
MSHAGAGWRRSARTGGCRAAASALEALHLIKQGQEQEGCACWRTRPGESKRSHTRISTHPYVRGNDAHITQ